MAATRTGTTSLATADGGVRLVTQYVSAGYFDALQVRPVLGRAFVGDDVADPDAPAVAVVSDRFWRTQLGASTDALGQTLNLNRQPVTVVGVAPAGFGGHVVGIDTDLYLPVTQAAPMKEMARSAFSDRRASWLHAVGRLAPGATLEEADTQVHALFERLAQAYPESNQDRTADVMELGPVPGAGRIPVLAFLAVLLFLVGTVLLVTCANVAGMFLARGLSRERDYAVRIALGSGRWRLVLQQAAEILVVLLLGGFAGIGLAALGLHFVDVAALPLPVELSLDLRPNGRVLMAGLGAAPLTGMVFGMAPALRASRTDAMPALREDSSGGRRIAWSRKAFAAGQVGLSFAASGSSICWTGERR